MQSDKGKIRPHGTQIRPFKLITTFIHQVLTSIQFFCFSFRDVIFEVSDKLIQILLNYIQIKSTIFNLSL